MIRYLHIMHDSIFADYIVQAFERLAPGENLFWVELPRNSRGFNLTTPGERRIPIDGLNLPKKIGQDKVRIVLFHSISGYNQKLISMVPEHVAVLWMAWGYDLYARIWKNEDHYLPLTLQYIKAHEARPPKMAARLKSMIRPVRNALFPPVDWGAEVIKRADYCSTVVPDEYNLAKSIPGFAAKPVRFNYKSLETIVSEMPVQEIAGDDIMVGNACTPGCNHVDAFHQIAASGQTRARIIVPLSYGAHGDYRDFVIERGRYYFGSRFHPLLELLPLPEYVRILAQCSNAVFNQNRQQALDNILMLTWMGARIHLNRGNTIVNHFQKLGIEVEDFTTSFTYRAPRTGVELTETRRKLAADYSERNVDERIRHILALRRK